MKTDECFIAEMLSYEMGQKFHGKPRPIPLFEKGFPQRAYSTTTFEIFSDQFCRECFIAEMLSYEMGQKFHGKPRPIPLFEKGCPQRAYSTTIFEIFSDQFCHS